MNKPKILKIKSPKLAKGEKISRLTNQSFGIAFAYVNKFMLNELQEVLFRSF